MKDGIASHTARSVAAQRLAFDRVPADYGDPAADHLLQADVAAGLEPSAGRMREYLRARTAFFDRVVVRALEAGLRQVVTGAAGYDGRALRYRKAGVRWFEVDHPATQADKLARLRRLGIDAGHVRFVAADFTTGPVGGLLREAGLDPSRKALFLFEGIAFYLDDAVTESVLAQFREVTISGSLLAISISTSGGSVSGDGVSGDGVSRDGVSTSGGEARAAFRAWVAAQGEPARSGLSAAEAGPLLARAGWQVTQPQARSPEESARQGRRAAAGLLTARATESDEP